MNKHTPGPWEANPYGRPTKNLHWQVDKTDSDVAVASLIGENAEANARLIAAAPALLEALECAVIGFDDIEQAGLLSDARRIADYRAAEARAILKQARGES